MEKRSNVNLKIGSDILYMNKISVMQIFTKHHKGIIVRFNKIMERKMRQELKASKKVSEFKDDS